MPREPLQAFLSTGEARTQQWFTSVTFLDPRDHHFGQGKSDLNFSLRYVPTTMSMWWKKTSRMPLSIPDWSVG